jgi:hypothetical protein
MIMFIILENALVISSYKGVFAFNSGEVVIDDDQALRVALGLSITRQVIRVSCELVVVSARFVLLNHSEHLAVSLVVILACMASMMLVDLASSQVTKVLAIEGLEHGGLVLG